MRTDRSAAMATLIALGLLLAGCGSDSTATTSSSSSSSAAATATTSAASPAKSDGNGSPTTSKAAAPTAPAAGAAPTLTDFITQNGLTAAPAKKGDPGIPTLNLPVPAGWQDAGPQTPEGAWGALKFADPAAAADPATITVNMTRLTGTFDQTKIFDYAAGQLKNLPGFQGSPGAIAPKKLGGYPAFQIAGAYSQDGVQRMIAQKTVVVPAKDHNGVFVIQINAAGVEDQMGPLLDATSTIDDKTTITP